MAPTAAERRNQRVLLSTGMDPGMLDSLKKEVAG